MLLSSLGITNPSHARRGGVFPFAVSDRTSVIFRPFASTICRERLSPFFLSVKLDCRREGLNGVIASALSEENKTQVGPRSSVLGINDYCFLVESNCSLVSLQSDESIATVLVGRDITKLPFSLKPQVFD